MKRDYLISAYFEGCAYFLTWGASTSASVFGGPPQVTISGIPGTILEADKLHYLGRLSHRDIPSMARQVSEIPLFYGFTFDGCELSYEFEPSSNVNLLDLCPARSSNDFPRTTPLDFPLSPCDLVGNSE
jgi:hypothetical protein